MGTGVTFLAISNMRNEGPHCLEWFAHHLALGIDHFLVYSNDCDDGTDEMLDLMQDAGLVTHIRLQSGAGKPVQWQALKHASDHPLLAEADWAVVIDTDEFITLQAPLATLDDLLDVLADNAAAVALTWRLFGNAGRIGMQPGLTCEHFTKAAPLDMALPLAHFFKSLFRPGAFRQLGVHRPKRKGDRVPLWLDGSGRALPERVAANDQRINLFGLHGHSKLVQLNHYSLRATENFMVKRARGLPNRKSREIGLSYWVERNFNIVEESSIRHLIPATQHRLDEIRKIPGLAAHEEQAFAIHKAVFDRMMTQKTEEQLFWHLVLCAGSQPPAPEQTRAHLERLSNQADRNAG